MSIIHSLRRSENGSSSIEFAVIGAFLILLTLGTVELGRITYMYHKLQSAVSVTTRMARIGAADEAIEAEIRSRFSPTEQNVLTIDIGLEVIDGLTYRRVDAQVDFPLIVPGFSLFSETDSIILNAVQLVPDA